MKILLNKRILEIINFLETTIEYVSLENLASNLNHPIRNLKYDLLKISQIFLTENLPELDQDKNNLRLLDAHRKWWRTENFGNVLKYEYIFSSKERQAIIIIDYLMGDKALLIDNLSDVMEVSRSTVLSDLKGLRSLLSDYEVNINYDAKNGYFLSGDATRFPALYTYFLDQLLLPIKKELLPHFTSPQVKTIYRKLEKLLTEMKIFFPSDTLVKLSIFTEKYNQELSPLKDFIRKREDHDQIIDRVIKEFPSLNIYKANYLSIYLMASRPVISYTGEDITKDIPLANQLLGYFESLINCTINSRMVLIHHLAKHLNRSIYRYRYGISDIFKPVQDAEVKQAFPLVKIAAMNLSKNIGYPINDNEVLLLTVHILNHLYNYPFLEIITPILLIVENISKADLIRSRLSFSFPMLEIVNIIESSMLPNEDYSTFDYIVSTVWLSTELPYVKISESLKDEEKRELLLFHSTILSKKEYFVDESKESLSWFELLLNNNCQFKEGLDTLGNTIDRLNRSKDFIFSDYIKFCFDEVCIIQTKYPLKKSHIKLIITDKKIVVGKNMNIRLIVFLNNSLPMQRFIWLSQIVNLFQNRGLVDELLKCKADESIYNVLNYWKEKYK